MRMQNSFVIFGRVPQLSFAELFQYAQSTRFVAVGEQGAILENSALGADAPRLLGGSVKGGIVLDTISSIRPEAIAKLLLTYTAEGEKFHFGLSAYSFGKKAPSSYDIKKLGLSIKKIIKAEGVSVRLVESRNATLSSVDVVKNKLIEKGAELCLLYAPDAIHIGITRSVQPFEAYSERDYDRPGRDAKRGMLPPKLARTMLQLALVTDGATVLDPFCGVGTVLQEGLLLGCKMIGTDIDEQAMLDSKKNLEWMRSETGMSGEYEIETYDVRALDKKLKPNSVDAVVTELDLGPPLSGTETREQIIETERKLSALYIDALDMVHTLLKSGGRVVFAWPYFIEHDLWISAYNKITKTGWDTIEPYAAEYQSVLPLTERNTIVYGREGQHIFREIVILKKQ